MVLLFQKLLIISLLFTSFVYAQNVNEDKNKLSLKQELINKILIEFQIEKKQRIENKLRAEKYKQNNN